MSEEKIPYLVENKERDTFTIYVKGTKPYLDLQQENKQLKEEKDTLYNALITTRTKNNNDKARYRRKAKRYRNILTELEKWINSYIPLLDAGDIVEESSQDTLKEVLDKIQELKEKYK